MQACKEKALFLSLIDSHSQQGFNSMAPLPKNSIDHFTHAHPLAAADDDQEFSCDGCKTIGIGKRFRCKACDFDLHDYCGTCPRSLPSFMHHHALTLVLRKPAKPGAARAVNRVCDVCRESVDGLFYRCKECEFDVHPLCTQLPEKLKHALHKVHPLILRSPPAAGACAVCRRPCSGWRYGCGACRVDIHLECVLEPVVGFQQHDFNTGQRGIPTFDHNTGIPFQAPPHFPPFYGYPYGPGYPSYGPGFNMYYGGGPNMYPPGNFAPQQAQNLQVSNNNNGNRVGKSMFGLVRQLGFGVISNMIFGVDVSGLF
ncbi:protein VACUOLELESS GAMETOPHYTES-like [Salvia miltiorrhiza]|uniref:protein VACUOLELESS GAMETOPHYTES-like n=1 Tax=Salvia miltiorrhiza TaxID=226208 RepID=UPI0025AD1461|nr:protein VACUOLELESS GAMETOPHYTES-like [Salvia miltiorrhiza]